MLSLNPISTKIADFTAIIQLRERIGMKADQGLYLAIEALQGQVVDLPVPTLKSRDLHYAENFWSEMRKRGWCTHYSTSAAVISQLGREATRLCRERGIRREESLQVIQGSNRPVDVGLYTRAILEEAFRRLAASGKVYVDTRSPCGC